MKSGIHTRFAGTLLLALAAASAAAQSATPSAQPPAASDPAVSLGDYARAVRQAKKPSSPKQFDNDSIPKDPTLSVVGNTGSDDANPATPAATGDAAGKPGAAEKADAAKEGESEAQRQAGYNAWKQKIDAQKTTIDSAAHELDLLEREYRLRASAFYGDAGNRLRNSAQWDQQNAQYQQQIADRQKAVDDAKQKLDDLQEEARKAGVPASMRE